jgi:hypothetical protein
MLDLAKGTSKFLPKQQQIPEEFYRGNVYTQVVEAIYFEDPLPAGLVKIRPEFQLPNAIRQMQIFVLGHLRSTEPTHEHKIAGVSYMLHKMAEFCLTESYT